MAKKKKYVASLTNQKHRTKMAYAFLSPWLIGVIIISLIPALMCLTFSFTSIVSTINGYEVKFIGFTNYAASMFGNVEVLPAMWDFIKKELMYVPVILIMAFIIAMILIKDIKAKSFFRSIFFLPVIIISGALVSIVFESTDITAANEALSINDPLTSSFIYRIIASYSTTIADFIVELFNQFVIILWLTGIPVILFINALQKINKDMYEAAAIDGANKWQILWKITIPNVRSIAFVSAIFAIVQVSTLPITNLYTLLNNALARNDMLGLACTYAMLYVILILLLIGFFALILVPKEKKSEEYVTITMKQQYDKTMGKLNKEVN